MPVRIGVLLGSMVGAVVLSGWMILQAESEVSRTAKGRRRWIAAQVSSVRQVDPVPEDFRTHPLARKNELVEIRVRLKNLPVGFHPGDLVLDRFDGGPGRIRLLREGIDPVGQLWDYSLLSPRRPEGRGARFPRKGLVVLALRFVVPIGFRTAVLDHRGRALARIER